ncbi:MAG: hypothetical protein QOE45_535 [Frankiaceae bacterium]|nr:hypothetical protein [Frankiaceae bacterium]
MKTVVAVAAAAALFLPAVPAVAVPRQRGLGCGYNSAPDWTGPPDTELAIINGGPFVVADLPRADWPGTDPTAPGIDPLANPVSATLTCTIRQGGYVTHVSPVLAAASASGTGVVVVPPTLVHITGSPSSTWGICTALDVTDAHGTTAHLYWDTARAQFGTDPSAVCFERYESDEFLEGLVCPVLAEAFPPRGDVVLPDPIGKVWDCPPYDPTQTPS